MTTTDVPLANYYRGVETDFRDFPFMQIMGISSYPYSSYSDPDQIPLDYFSRLRDWTRDSTHGRGGRIDVGSGSIQSIAETWRRAADHLRKCRGVLEKS